MGRREEPVPEGPLHDFAQGLRDLRAAAPDRPTYRELAKTARFSQSVLSVAAAGRALPTWEVTRAYVQACGGEVELWRERWTALRDKLRATNPGLITESDDEGDGRPLPAAVTPLRRSDPARIGPFRLLGRLGGGAMGRVYLGMSKAGRPVSVKIVHPHLAEDPLFRRRFAAEVAAVRRVRGIYTPAVVDADPDADLPWMATTYVAGPSLGDVVATGGPLPPATVLGLAAGIAEALVTIHGSGVLHRDLKPANVLLDRDGPKVIDFGVSFTADGTALTQTGARVGTTPFMAPEQVNTGRVTGAADVFSLGSLLAYAATGIPPFGDGSPGEVLYRVAHAAPDPAALDCANNQLRDLIVRCLDKSPERRPTPEQIVDACSADQPRWLPATTATRAERYGEDVTALIRQTLAHDRRRSRLRRVGVPGAAAVVAVVTAVLIPRLTGGPPPAKPSPYTLAYQDRRLTLPDYNYFVDLVAGQVVEGHGEWTMSSNAGGDGRGAFELPDDTAAYIPTPAEATMTADQCATGVAKTPTKPDVLDGDHILHFAWAPPHTSFCLMSRQTKDIAVIRVIDTDSGNYGAKLAIDYYDHS